MKIDKKLNPTKLDGSEISNVSPELPKSSMKMNNAFKKFGKLVAIVLGIGGGIFASEAIGSPILGDAYSSKKDGKPAYPITEINIVTLTNSRNSIVRHIPLDLQSRWGWNTVLDTLQVGDILFIKADISSYHFRNSYIIRTIDPLGRNFPPAIVFAKDTSKAFSLSVNKVDNKLGIPDTAITGYFWAQKDPNKVDTARVEKYFPLGGWGYHDLVLGVEGDSTIRTEDWMKWILQFSRSGSTFRTQDSFQVDKPFDGNARLIDTVIFPRDTIPPVGVKQPGLLLEIKQNSVLPTIVKAACFRPELAGQNIYSANGRKVNKQTLTRSLSPGIYYVIKKDATSPKKLIVVR